MDFTLNSQNLFTYLRKNIYHDQENFGRAQIELKRAKNFNLLLSFENKRKILIKQERVSQNGETANEFIQEVRVQKLFDHFSELISIRSLFPELIHFDLENSIVVFNYLSDYRDIADFYSAERRYPDAIATAVGAAIARIHRATINHSDYQEFLLSFKKERKISEKSIPMYLENIDRVTPEVFGALPADGLKFLTLYQRFDSLGKAIASIRTTYQPCCLTHNDLKFNNLLLHDEWEDREVSPDTVRIIDWERSDWGDPAFDLGSLIANYTLIWLESLVISKDIPIEESLQMAIVPLELLHPSLNALLFAYLKEFPEVLQHLPTFPRRAIQFAGLVLIHQIQAMLQYHKVFNNTGICMLQVAKSFLCRPKESIATVFGRSEEDLLRTVELPHSFVL